ncbi:hypothetical protein H4R35_002300 [Dimargaris xerosporica]|nr:hypothetical protein H4R35_002300 [Dimargaris xerosporica]
MMIPDPLQSNEALDGGRVAWTSQVLLCPFYAPKPMLLMSLSQKQAAARYYYPGDPHHLLETSASTTTDATELPLKAMLDATDGQDLLRSGHEAIQADHRLPAATAPVPGIDKLSQELTNSEARDARLLRAVFDVEATKDAPSFTHTVLHHVTPAGWAKLVELGIVLVNPTPDQLLAQATAFEQQPEQAPCTRYVEKSGAIWLRDINYTLKLPAVTSTIHLALQDATWAQRREAALDLKEPWGGPLAIGEEPWHVSPFRVSPYYLQVPVSSFAIAAIASRCFGQALQPNFEAPLARCAQGHAFNPLPLDAIPAAADGQADLLFNYESNPVRMRQRTSLEQLARQTTIPDTAINTLAVASDRCDVDFWPRHVVDFLLRTSNLSSSMVNNRLVPYLLMRHEWGMVHLAMFHAKDIPEAHIILALQHRIRHVAAQLHAAAALKTSYPKVDADQVPAPEFHFAAYVATEGVVDQIVLKVLNDTAALAYITAALSYRMDPVTTVKAMRAVLQPEDTLVLVRLLESLWSTRDAMEKLTATWYQADQAIGKVLPALTDISAFLIFLLDAHMAIFINHPELSAVVTGLQLRLKRVKQNAKRLQAQLLPWLLVFPQADKAWWAEYPPYRGIKASTINVTKRPFTFALSMRQLHLAAAEESKQTKARPSDSSYLGQSFSLKSTLPTIPLALRRMMTLDSTALDSTSVTLNSVSIDEKRGQVGMWTRSAEYTDRLTRRQPAQHLLGTMESDVLRQSFRHAVARLKSHDEHLHSQPAPARPTSPKSAKAKPLRNQTFRVDLIQW